MTDRVMLVQASQDQQNSSVLQHTETVSLHCLYVFFEWSPSFVQKMMQEQLIYIYNNNIWHLHSLSIDESQSCV